MVVAALVGALVAVAQATPPPATFGPKSDFSTGNAPASVAVGDLNGDGRLDLAVAESVFPGGVSVRLGNGAGGMGLKVTFAFGNPMSSVAIGDLNGDDHPDLVASTVLSERVLVLLGNGAGAFVESGDFGIGPNPFSVVLGDLNGDGHLDIVVGSVDYSGFSTVAVLLGDGTGGFAQTYGSYAHQLPSSLALADLNGDGDLDLVTSNYLSLLDLDNPDWAGVSVWLGNGAGGFGPATDYLSGFLSPRSVALADLNGDGDIDVAVVNNDEAGGGGGAVRLGDGSGAFGAEIAFDTGGDPWSLAVGDVSRDGLVDLVVANSGSNTVSVQHGNGTGGFGSPTHFATGTHPVSVAVADLNGVGGADLVVANRDSNTVSVLPNTSPTVPAAPSILRNATAGNAEATVSWTAPASDGGSSITGYVVTPYIGYFQLSPSTFSSTATTQIVTGLTNGTTYRFKIAAVNAVGTGPASKVTNPVTPAPTAPTAPTIGTAVAGNGNATVSWTAPASDGGSPISGYVVTPYIGYFPLSPQTFTSTATTQVVTGLTNGTTYRFRVQAINGVGTGPYSKVTNAVSPTA